MHSKEILAGIDLIMSNSSTLVYHTFLVVLDDHILSEIGRNFSSLSTGLVNIFVCFSSALAPCQK